jgi:hypothetical protein
MQTFSDKHDQVFALQDGTFTGGHVHGNVQPLPLMVNGPKGQGLTIVPHILIPALDTYTLSLDPAQMSSHQGTVGLSFG